MKRNRLWRGVLCLFSGFLFAQTWESFDRHVGLPSDTVQAVCIDGNGHKWFGTKAGLVRYTGSEWIVYRKTEGRQTIASDDIRDIAFEASGYGPEIWLATSDGVSVVGITLDGVTLATPYRTQNTGLIHDGVHAVGVDGAHRRWFGTEGGVSMFDGRTWTSWTTAQGLSHRDIRSVGIDERGGWRYFGTRGGGVSRLQVTFDGITSASPYDYAWSGLMSDTILAVWVEPHGDQWFGTPKGLAYHDTTETKLRWRIWTSTDGLLDDRIQALAQDPQGRLWIGTSKGVSVWDGSTFAHYTTADGLIHEDVRDIAIDQDGSVWIATAGGISHYLPPSSTVAGMAHRERGFVLYPNHPNPFNPETRLSFTLVRDAWVSAIVYDLSGRGVRTLCDRTYGPGAHLLVWDGCDESGVSVATGVYGVRFWVVGSGWREDCLQKITLIR